MSSSRRYSEKEIAQILRRAGELQASDGEELSSEPGFGLEELERIAGEVGIDATHVRIAAAELDTGALAKKRFSWTGAPELVNSERTVGGELSDEGWEESIVLLRRTFEDAGQTSQTGATLEWRSSVGDLLTTTVTATRRNGRTRFQIMRDYSGGIFLSMLVCAVLTLFGALGLGQFLAKSVGLQWGLLAGGGLFVAVATLLRGVFSRWGAKDAKKLGNLLDTLSAMPERPAQTGARIEEQADIELRLQ